MDKKRHVILGGPYFMKLDAIDYPPCNEFLKCLGFSRTFALGALTVCFFPFHT